MPFFNVGDVVRVRGDTTEGALGRICHYNGISYCVQFPENHCLKMFEADLEIADGNAPECSPECSQGLC